MAPNPPATGDWPCFGGGSNCASIAAGGLVIGVPVQVWPKSRSGCGQIYSTFQTTTATGTGNVTVTVTQGSPAKTIFKISGSIGTVLGNTIEALNVSGVSFTGAVAGAATINVSTKIGLVTIKGAARIVLHYFDTGGAHFRASIASQLTKRAIDSGCSAQPGSFPKLGAAFGKRVSHNGPPRHRPKTARAKWSRTAPSHLPKLRRRSSRRNWLPDPIVAAEGLEVVNSGSASILSTSLSTAAGTPSTHCTLPAARSSVARRSICGRD